MPPVLNSLGPITDWLSGILFGPVIQKYDAVNKASSAAKVSHKASPLSMLEATIGLLFLLQSTLLALQCDVAADPVALDHTQYQRADRSCLCNSGGCGTLSAFVLQADKAFSDLRQAIQSNNGYVLGSFTYADVAMALACDKIKPLSEPYVR